MALEQIVAHEICSFLLLKLVSDTKICIKPENFVMWIRLQTKTDGVDPPVFKMFPAISQTSDGADDLPFPWQKYQFQVCIQQYGNYTIWRHNDPEH